MSVCVFDVFVGLVFVLVLVDKDRDGNQSASPTDPDAPPLEEVVDEVALVLTRFDDVVL